MTNLSDAYEAGIDALLADNALTRGGFADAIRTVVNQAYSGAEAKAWIDQLSGEYQRVGQINQDTFGSFRAKIIADGKALALLRFEALAVSVSSLTESATINTAIELINLRAERDEADGNIDILVGLKPGQPRQVREAIQLGIDQLRGYKQQVRQSIQVITGDPDN